MKRVLINKLKGGEILAQEVLDHKGSLWLAEGTTYKSSYIDKLSSLEINYIYIEEVAPEKTNLEIEFSSELLQNQSKELIAQQLMRFHKSGSVNIYKFEKLIHEIINDIMKHNNIIENLYRVKSFDNYTYEHSLNVTVIGIMISKQMELPKSEIYDIAIGCILHDIGKTQIAEEILNKPAILTIQEFNEIKNHSIRGYNIVKDNKKIKNEVKEIILTHHEKLDGSGYPFGISGSQISVGARICSIADVFDAMCSARPYKMPVPFAESIRTIKTNMNKKLDMNICKELENVLK